MKVWRQKNTDYHRKYRANNPEQRKESWKRYYDKNKEKHLLDEVTAAAAVGGFTGKGGQLVDKLFAGGFHPEFGDIYNLLSKQIDDKIMKRLFSDEHTPDFERDW